MVKNIARAGWGSYPWELVAIGDLLYFITNNGELWVSDGTKEGTRKVRSIGRWNEKPRDLLAVGGRLFFAADDGVHGRELWTSDGTPAGTFMVRDINWGESSGLGWFEGAALPDGRFFFPADDGYSGVELWSTDGTKYGTRRVKNISRGLISSYPREFAEFNGRFFVSGEGELWATDGSYRGTRLVADINPTGWSSPSDFTVGGEALFFTAKSGRFGEELWALRAGPGSRGVPELRTVDDLDGLGTSDLAVLGSTLSLFDGESGVEMLSSAFAPTLGWEAVDFEVVDDLNGSSSQEIAILARQQTRARVFVRDALTGDRILSRSLQRRNQPLDLEVIPGQLPFPPRVAVLEKRGLGRRATVEILPLSGGFSPLEISVPASFDALDIEILPHPYRNGGSGYAVAVLGQSEEELQARVLIYDAATGDWLADVSLDDRLVPIDLEVVQKTPSASPRLSVLAQKRWSRAGRIITLDPANGSILRRVRLGKKHLFLDFETEPGRDASPGARVSVLWTDRQAGWAGVTTRSAFSGKRQGRALFPGVYDPKDISLLSLPEQGESAVAVLGRAECADLKLAITLRGVKTGELLGCYPVD